MLFSNRGIPDEDLTRRGNRFVGVKDERLLRNAEQSVEKFLWQM